MPRKQKTTRSAKRGSPKNKSTAQIGFEQKLWLAADKLRGTMDAAEYKHTVLGLIFLKYISDSFESHRSWLLKQTADSRNEYHVTTDTQRQAILEDRDEYLSENVFWVPPEARWASIQKNAKQPNMRMFLVSARVPPRKRSTSTDMS